MIFVFCNCVVKHRLEREYSFWGEVVTGLFYLVFYSGTAWPVCAGIVVYLFSCNAAWGATVKTLPKDGRCQTALKVTRNRIPQLVYASSLVSLCFVLYYVWDCEASLAIFCVASLGFGHLLSPYLLTPGVFCTPNYCYDVADSPGRP